MDQVLPSPPRRCPPALPGASVLAQSLADERELVLLLESGFPRVRGSSGARRSDGL